MWKEFENSLLEESQEESAPLDFILNTVSNVQPCL